MLYVVYCWPILWNATRCISGVCPNCSLPILAPILGTRLFTRELMTKNSWCNGRKLKKYYFPPFYFSNPLYQNFSTSLFSNVSVKQNYCQTLVINHSSTDDASEVWKTLSYVFKIHVTSLVTVIHHGKGVWFMVKKVLKNWWYHQKMSHKIIVKTTWN